MQKQVIYAKVGYLYEFRLYDFVANIEKEFESSSFFISKIKTKLLDFENGVTFF